MDSRWVNTSLGLNVIPSHHAGEAPPKIRDLLEGDIIHAKFEGNSSVKEEVYTLNKQQADGQVLAEELHRISFENKKLTEMLTALCHNYNTLQSHVKELMNTKLQQHKNCPSSPENELTPNSNNSKKRKADSNEEYYNMKTDEDYPCKRPKENINLKISRVYVRTEASDTRLIVKDGYQWRKYGQKVTRDNPSPRAYYKCSFAPSCPVKKKVQKSAENPCCLVATYEGEHNHMHPETRAEVTLIGTPISPTTPSPTGANHHQLIASQNLSKDSRIRHLKNNMCAQEIEGDFQQFLVQQMASSLTKDPNFASALASAISGSISDHPRIPKW